MDSSSEMGFIHSLNTYKKDKTMILISHKNSLLNIANRLILLDQGEIVIDGTKEEVVAQIQKSKQRVSNGS